jgi:hypothetical protein
MKFEVLKTNKPDCSFLDGGVETALNRINNQQIAYNGFLFRGEFDRPLSFLGLVPENERHAVHACLNNHDVQQQAYPSARRVVIDVFDALESAGLKDSPPAEQEGWLKVNLPFLYSELTRSVKEYRLSLPGYKNNIQHKSYWWLFGETRVGLRGATRDLDQIIAIGRVGKALKPCFIGKIDKGTGLIVAPSHSLYLIPTKSIACFTLLNSFLFEAFSRRLCSTLGLGLALSFSPSDVFPFFPFAWDILNPPDSVERRLKPVGDNLIRVREEMMVDFNGITSLYNAFDDPANTKIEPLREAHRLLEEAVLAEYGWGDLVGWGFDRPWVDGSLRYVPDGGVRQEYLRRLEQLNQKVSTRD